jgi:hypothetical protein
MKIVSEYPTWQLFLCFVIGFLVAAWLYFRSDFPDKKLWRIILFILRGFGLSLVGILLLNPYIIWEKYTEQPPVVALLLDNSESLKLAANHEEYLNKLPKEVAAFLENPPSNAIIKTFRFGNTVEDSSKLNFNQQSSDFSAASAYVKSRLAAQNLGAVVVVSDGIYNKGANPLYAFSELQVPIYTIRLGDTIPRNDVSIQRVEYSDIVFQGNILQIKSDIKASGFSNVPCAVSLEEKSDKEWKKLQSSTITPNSNSSFHSVSFSTTVEGKGLKQYRIQAEQLKNEVTTSNNIKDFVVEVVDTRSNILILSSAPHPDLGIIRQALDAQPQYKTEIGFLPQWNGNLANYQLVILKQIPESSNQLALIQRLKASNIPILLLSGNANNLTLVNQLSLGISVSPKGGGINKVEPLVNNGFNYFDLDDRLFERSGAFPPLDAPNVSISLSGDWQTAMFQQIGSVKTPYPLLAFNQQNGYRTAFLAAEGIWRWRLSEAESGDNESKTLELVRKIIQFLILKEDKQPFKVRLSQTMFDEGDDIIFNGSLFNKNLEPVRNATINLSISSAGRKSLQYSMQESGDGYMLNAGSLPPGIYNYRASTKYDGKELISTGSFSVNGLNIEGANLTADHNLLRQLSANSKGKSYTSNEWDKLKQAIEQQADLKPIRYKEISSDEFIRLKSLLWMIGALFSLEWMVRKYFGRP